MRSNNRHIVAAHCDANEVRWLQEITTRIRALLVSRMEGPANVRILWATVTIIILTVLAKLVSAGKEMMLAYYFGTSGVLDAFFIAFTLFTFSLTVIAGSFQSSLVPTFIQVRVRDGDAKAYRLYQSALLCGIGLLTIVALILLVLTPGLLSYIVPDFSEAKRVMTQKILFIMLPMLLAGGLSMIWSSLLNTDERFGVAALSPSLVPLTVMIVLAIYGSMWGVYGLAIGTLCGFVAQSGLLAIFVKHRGLPLLPRWNGLSEDLRSLISQYTPLVGGALLMCSTLLVDQTMAALLGSGSVAILNYGVKVVALLELGAISLGTAVLPYFSKMVTDSNWRGVRGTLRTYILLVLIISVPITILLMWYSEPIVRILYQRGAFTAADTVIVSDVQAYYLLQIPFYAVGMVIVRLISAMKDNKVLLCVSGINVVTNISFNLLFMHWLGIAGIALSTSCVYLISSIILFITVNKKLKRYKIH